MSNLLEVDQVHVTFRLRGRRRKGLRELRAVDGVSLRVGQHEIVGLVGESGSGKSTLGLLICGLNDLTAGTMRLDDEPLGTGHRRREVRRAIQMVFQDPFSSLNPRMTAAQHLAELLRVHHLASGPDVRKRCVELMSMVVLPAELLDARPRALSGGQCQRVAIARALALGPRLLVADEPVSALDVSVQAGIIALFASLRQEFGLSILFIAHDLAVVRHLCDRVAVMYMGRIVEEAETAALFGDPRHPYTRGLLAAVPRLDPGSVRRQPAVLGDPPSLLRLPEGCRFRSRCPLAADVCRQQEPALEAIDGEGHLAACHFAARPLEPAP